ncbi:uncharacterized protein LOC117110078 [Anneissia japonica]|uniref:uncharacterized protein LOC117110078 n=1 Tax=Anneissia japonica TaxID=1529436 RepID=UPI0014258B80|nr:uncharacterized protein LOC117110078 [Anneissia japonica]
MNEEFGAELFQFSERPNFEEVGCVVPNCCNNILSEYRKSRFLLHYPDGGDVERSSAWHKILEDEFGTVISEEILSICGKHFIDGCPSEKFPNPVLFGQNVLSNETELAKKAQRYCCIRNCRYGPDFKSHPSSRKIINYYSLNLLCDDSIGRNLLKKLMSSTLYVGLENHTSFFCSLHFKANILNQKRIQSDNNPGCGLSKIKQQKTQPSSSDKVEVESMNQPKQPCNMLTLNVKVKHKDTCTNWAKSDEDCCVIPTCPFSDIRMKYRSGNSEFRPAMFTFPSLSFQPHTRLEWLRLVRAAMPLDQKKFCPKITTMICSRHFPNGSPTATAPNPSLLTEYVKPEGTNSNEMDDDSPTRFIIDISNEDNSNIKISVPKKKRRKRKATNNL